MADCLVPELLAGWLLAGCLLTGWLVDWLASWLACSIWLARAAWLEPACWLAHDRLIAGWLASRLSADSAAHKLACELAV